MSKTSVNAPDNSSMLNYRADAGTVGFTPKVSFHWDTANKEVDLSEQSTFPSGVALKRTLVKIHDKFGNHVALSLSNGYSSGESLTETADIETLDTSKGLDITATVIANDNKLVADGGAYDIAVDGELSNWDKQKNA